MRVLLVQAVAGVAGSKGPSSCTQLASRRDFGAAALSTYLYYKDLRVVSGTNPLAIRPDVLVSAPPVRVRVFCLACALFSMVYGALDFDPSPLMRVLLSYGPMVVVTTWLAADTKRRLVDAHDLGLLFAVAWPVAIPWYALRSGGRGRWGLALRLYALVLASPIGYMLGATVGYLFLDSGS